MVLTARISPPTVRRHRVRDGFVGDERTVELTVESDATSSADVADAVGEGLTATGTDPIETTMVDGEDRIRYELTFERRGKHVLGPASITVRDVFGLVERRFTYEDRTTVRAYPRVYDLTEAGVGDLEGLEDAAGPDREEFDHLREYQRGDPLRDVHWKSAAKRPDRELVVTEYVADEDAGSITIAAECEPGRDDELARAVASVATALLDRDRRVGLTVGDETLSPESGTQHRHELLGLLAVLGPCDLADDDRAAADVVVTTDGSGTRVVVDGRERRFWQLVRDPDRLHAIERSRGRERDRHGRRRNATGRTDPVDGDGNGDGNGGSSGVAA